MSPESVTFYFAAIGAVAGALGVVLAKSPLRGALSLIVSLCFIAVLYVLLDASFVAAMQVLVYAGAVMVLFLFVIMLLNLRPHGGTRLHRVSLSKPLGSMAVVYVVVRIIHGVVHHCQVGRVVDGSIAHIGHLLVTDYFFGFAAVSVVLLVAVVGAVVLGMKRLT